jgi:hypothetical protein
MPTAHSLATLGMVKMIVKWYNSQIHKHPYFDSSVQVYTYRFSQHLPNRKDVTKHFWILSALSIFAVFSVAVLSRSELRLSGEVMGAVDDGDLARLFEFHNCTTVTRVRRLSTTRLYHVDCHPYDYLVESVKKDEEWVVVGVEKIRD